MDPGQQPLLFQLLDAMDGLDGDADVLFLLTTNRADLLERALAQRPGRVDLAVEVPLPNEDARLALYRLYAGGLPVSDEVLAEAAARTDGVTASFAKELLRRAVLIGADAGRTSPTPTSGPRHPSSSPMPSTSRAACWARTRRPLGPWTRAHELGLRSTWSDWSDRRRRARARPRRPERRGDAGSGGGQRPGQPPDRRTRSRDRPTLRRAPLRGPARRAARRQQARAARRRRHSDGAGPAALRARGRPRGARVSARSRMCRRPRPGLPATRLLGRVSVPAAARLGRTKDRPDVTPPRPRAGPRRRRGRLGAIDESPGRVLAIAEAAILRADPEHAPLQARRSAAGAAAS